MDAKPKLFDYAADSVVEKQMELDVEERGSDYQEQIIRFKIGIEIFRVSSGRLTLRSALFKQMFSLPQASPSRIGPDEPIDCSDLDREAFVDYLWYLHADPLISQRFFAQPPSISKCLRLLHIALVAHRFEATDLSTWAISEALKMLCDTTREFKVNWSHAKYLLEIAGRMQAPDQSFIAARCRDVVCDALHPDRGGDLCNDPASALDIARDNQFVLAHVYFCILLKGRRYAWKTDKRLLPVDRLRLLCGSYSLGGWAAFDGQSRRRWDVAQNLTNESHTGVDEWSPLMHWELPCARDKLWQYFDQLSWRIDD